MQEHFRIRQRICAEEHPANHYNQRRVDVIQSPLDCISLFNKYSPRCVHIYTALVVVVGWVFFRADTLADAKVLLHQMFTWENGIYPASLFVNRKVIFLAVLGVLLSGIVQSVCPKLREHLYEKEVTKTVDIVIMAVLLFLCTMYLVSSTYNPFIYFRF